MTDFENMEAVELNEEELKAAAGGKYKPLPTKRGYFQYQIQPGDTTDDGLFTLNATRCLGACGLAPVMMIGEDVFGRLTPDQVPGILDKFRA